ncbi:MAG: metalloregulator ArsR/SmtB family transcription factor [Anaerolineae bacterium]|nr:metalloregulator ArsR/SmtB family transcription factor [Anaerolineae bacterium]
MIMDHRAFKTEINEQFARIAKAIANPHRLEIVDLLAQGERSVEELAKESALSVANASQHLQALREAHLVTTRKEGLRVYYRLADPTVYQLVQLIREIAERQLAELERIVNTYLLERKSMEPVTLNELLTRLREPGLVILDVRPTLEYAQGHIAGARSIPIDELQQRLHELPQDQEIVAYCRGAYCVFADEAVELLAARGYQARRMQQGYPDWKLADLPTETE